MVAEIAPPSSSIGTQRKRSAQALWAEGSRMDARRDKTRRSRGLVHDSRTPPGGERQTEVM